MKNIFLLITLIYLKHQIRAQSLPYSATYLGCFADNSSRALWETVDIQVNFPNLTVSGCINFCGRNQYQFAGLQAGFQCFCGQTPDVYGKRNESECNSKCNGNRTQSCGGSWRNSVYKLEISERPKPDIPYNGRYLGCFVDRSNRDLDQTTVIQYVFTNLTLKMCAEFCYRNFQNYFGVQAGYACFCGRSFGRYGKVNENNCATRCQGNRDQRCGGGWRNSIYQIDAPQEPPLPYNAEYKGCFQDQSTRDLWGTLDTQVDIPNNTIQACLDLCHKNNYEYAGCQAGGQCFCGSDYGRFGQRPESECSSRCPGNRRQICGGGLRNSIYKINVPAKPKLILPRNATYVGCYEDQGSRDLDDATDIKVNFDTDNTIEGCIEFCYASGAEAAGLQASKQCFCGSKVRKYRQREERECWRKCSGNPSQKCGANWRNSIYQFDPKPLEEKYGNLPFNAEYLGCFEDRGDRDLDEVYVDLGSNATVQNCINYCRNFYTSYAGLQNNRQCFCGLEYGKYGKRRERDCRSKCTGNSNQTCGGTWRNSVFKFTPRPNPCDANPCPNDQTCKANIDGSHTCRCSAGRTRDSNGQCCKYITCGCWGDPHCHSFDGAPFEFQGRCKYNTISTSCYNSTLPADLVPFTVKHKQENRDGVPNAANVAFVRYVELNVFNSQIRLLKKSANLFQYSINGFVRNDQLYSEPNRYTIAVNGDRIKLTTSFGLTISWDGNHRFDAYLCDKYAGYVCGLCGNADGVKDNDYVDPQNQPVKLIGNRYTQYFAWGSTHRVFDDSPESIDISNSPCNPDNQPGTIEGPACRDPSVYEGNNWCGAFIDPNGVWDKCVENLSKDVLERILNGCVFDLCVFEGNSTQRSYLCSAFEQFNSQCLQLGAQLRQSWNFNWRVALNCPKTCDDPNKRVSIQTECPRTCLNPDGKYDCGATEPTEGCFCRSDYVLNSEGKCVPLSSCGCRTADGRLSFTPGSTRRINCVTDLYCNPNTRQIEVRNRTACNSNAFCQPDQNGSPKCVCRPGYNGNGYTCTKITTTTRVPDAAFTSSLGTYLGCYQDKSDRDFKGKHVNNRNTNSPDNCIAYCGKLGFVFAGLQFGSHCFCANTSRIYQKLPNERCNVKCSGDNSKLCGGSWANAVFAVSNPSGNPCDAIPSPCGLGATCNNVDGNPQCSCPAGRAGNPKVRCCKALSCICWGDPHCTSYDGAIFHFMGRCKYDLTTTNCRNSTLPPALSSFSIQQRQEERFNRQNVAFIKYVNITLAGNSFILPQRNGTIKFLLNNAEISPPYSNDQLGVNVYTSGSFLVFSSDIGLTVRWSGSDRAEVLLCDYYSKYVCGQCGNADGNSTNDYVDRNNNPFSLVGNHYTKYFNWGNQWRTPEQDAGSIDLDKSNCEAPPSLNSTISGPSCPDQKIFETENWCGIMKSNVYPWGKIYQQADTNNKTSIDSLLEGCVFDLCSFYNNSTALQEYKCKALTQFFARVAEIDPSTKYNWRTVTGCLPTCGTNEVFETRSSCAKTCLNPDGNYDCGIVRATEDCYCQDGYVRYNSQCIKLEQCGCTLLDNSAVIKIGEVVKSLDCKYRYSCPGPMQTPIVENLSPCSIDASCVADLNNQPTCKCNQGYIGDGFKCDPEPQPVLVGDRLVYPKCEFSNTTKSCFIYGDPHIRTFDDYRTLLAPNCTYLIASDECSPSEQSLYQIFGIQEYRPDSPDISYLGEVKVKYRNRIYKLRNDLSVDGKIEQLPYESIDEDVKVEKIGDEIFFSTRYFIFYNNPIHDLFSFNKCGNTVCGLCGRQLDGQKITHDNDFSKYMENDTNDANCKSDNKFPTIKIE